MTDKDREEIRKIVREEIVKLLTVIEKKAEWHHVEREVPWADALEDLANEVTSRGYEQVLRSYGQLAD